MVDSHGFVASGGSQGTDSTLTVSNVSPSITASTISLLDTDLSGNLTLTVEQSTTTGFKATFTVVDNNSCQNLASGNEIASAIVNIRRSGISQANCDQSGEYNANNCYTDASASWDPSCVQDGGSCSGTTDTDATWTCTFPIQYHADPTFPDDSTVQYPTNNWVATIQATDDNSANTGLVDSTTGSDKMGCFMSYDLNTASIAYGSLSPGGTSASDESTVLEATGNVGLDENLSGTDMGSGGNTIDKGQQHYSASASQDWSSMTAITDSATELELNCAKTTTTASPATATTYWKIKIPDGQAAGSYSGTNTIPGIQGESASW